MTPKRAAGSLSLSRDTDSRAALASLSQELDDLSKSLDKNLTFQDLRNLRDSTTKDHRSTHNIAPTPTPTDNLEVVNSVDVSSLGSALEVSSAANRHHHLDLMGGRYNNKQKIAKGTNGDSRGNNELINRLKGRGSSSNSIASMEKQTEYLNHLLQRTRNDKRYTGGENDPSDHAKPAPVDDSIYRRAYQQQQSNRHRGGSIKNANGKDDESSPAQLQSPPFSFSEGLASRLFDTPAVEEKIRPRGPSVSSRGPSSSSAALHNLKEILKAKDERILYLEEENAFLRSLLLKLQQQEQQQNSTTTAEGHSKSQQSPKRETNNEGGGGGPRASDFTPGTKFVARLAELTDIDVGNHAPISFVIDKHWDKIMKGTGNENHI